jgi:N-ethylmaleimide reductase
LQRGGPFNKGDRDTYYGGGAKGYTDYSTLSDESAPQ